VRPAPPERLIVSLHIPKTGGTSFAAVLEQAFPGRVAYFYKAHNRRTHPRLRGGERSLTSALIAELEAEGVRVLHGHGAFKTYAAAVPEPRRYWTWVRDPVERVISSYFYHRKRQDDPRTADKGPAKAEGLSLEQFARTPANRNLQSRILAGAPVESLGFVGVTEQYERSLARIGLDPVLLSRSKNVNRARPETGEDVRALIAELNSDDADLYRRALELLEARLTQR
jgi:hypothetical protein